MNKMMKRILSILLSLVLVAAMTACGGSNSNSSSAKEDSAANANSGESAEAENSKETSEKESTEKEAVTFKVGVGSMAQNISPFTSFTNRQPVNYYLYECLIGQNSDGTFYGIIAKDWKTEDDITYHFEIYDYVKDSAGNAITAADVVFSIEHSISDTANTWITSAVQTGDYTLDITFANNQVSTFTTGLTRAPIVSKAAYETSADGMTTSSINTAIYMVTEFVPNVSITFTKNPNYWQTDDSAKSPFAKNSNVDELQYTKISESAQQTIALETGSIDVFEGIASTEVENFLEGGRNYDTTDAFGFSSGVGYVLYFGSEGMGANQDFRLACLYAIDKSTIVKGAFNGLASVPKFQGDELSDLVPSSASDDYFAYDLEKSQQYLKASGYAGEELTLLVPNEPSHSKIATIIQAQLIAAGINATKMNTYDNALFQNDFSTPGAFDLAVCQMGFNDVAFVWSFLSKDMAGFGMSVADDKLNELVSKCLTVSGHTVENATLASDYINEMGYGENLVQGVSYFVFNKKCNVKDMVQIGTTYMPSCVVFND